MSSNINERGFAEIFPTNQSCYFYLAKLKWGNAVYCCENCGSANFKQIQRPFGRCCLNCSTEERVRTGTLFEDTKIPLRKAFYIVFVVLTGHTGASSIQLGRILKLGKNRCWLFKRRILHSLKQPHTGVSTMEQFDKLFAEVIFDKMPP